MIDSPDDSASVIYLDLQGVEFSSIFSIEGRLGILKGPSNISINKYYISILPGTVFICSFPIFC